MATKTTTKQKRMAATSAKAKQAAKPTKQVTKDAQVAESAARRQGPRRAPPAPRASKVGEAAGAREVARGPTEPEVEVPVSVPEAIPAPAPTPRVTSAALAAEGAAQPRPSELSVPELQAKYLEAVGRPTGSSSKAYILWKIREAQKGRIPVGPRKTRVGDGESGDMRILPLRLEAKVVDSMDEAWRSRGIRNRMDFFRRALGYYLTHLGAGEAAVLFAAPSAAGTRRSRRSGS